MDQLVVLQSRVVQEVPAALTELELPLPGAHTAAQWNWEDIGGGEGSNGGSGTCKSQRQTITCITESARKWMEICTDLQGTVLEPASPSLDF